jgi:hypothetical protein
LSVKALADSGYTTIFHPHDEGAPVLGAQSFDLTVKGKPLLTGYRASDGLWHIPLVANEQSSGEQLCIHNKRFHNEAIHNVYDLPSNEQVIPFLHASLGFLTKRTLIKAIHNVHLNSFPRLTVNAVNKHFPESDETQKGHMKQNHQGT